MPMPAMKRQGVPGCCAGSLYYDIGVAHGRTPAQNVEQFANHLLRLGWSTVNTVITNDSQGNERKYLEACGFKEVSKQGRLHVHIGWHGDITKALEPFRQAAAKKLEEERQKKVAAEQERMRIAREKAEKERQAAQAAFEKVKANLPKGMLVPVKAAEITTIRHHFGTGLNFEAEILRRYGVKGIRPSMRRDYWGYSSPDSTATARRINTALRKQGRLFENVS